MNVSSRSDERGSGAAHAVLRWIAWVGRAAAWLIVPILALVLVGVVLSALKVGTIFHWEEDIFLFGSKLTLSSLGDLQWHLFGVMLMLTMAGTLVTDSHVRVDFLRQHMTGRTRRIVDLIGHLLFLLPFALVLVWHGWGFASRAFRIGEGSNYDGLYDRFIIKAFIPIGFFLLAVAGLCLALLCLRRLMNRGEDAGS